MGNFETVMPPKYFLNRSRTVLKQSVGPNAVNTPRDLNLIACTLMNAGLLDKDATASSTRDAVYAAIRQVRRSLQKQDILSKKQSLDVQPGDMMEHAVRSAIVQGRLSLSHRIIAESTHQKEPRKIIDGGMTRALQRLKTPSKPNHDLKSPYSRALLPTISAQTFQANRRLAEALIQEENIIGLIDVIACTITENGKQGYSDVKDFMSALRQNSPEVAQNFGEQIQCQLKGKALRRFHKLLVNRPPIEGDFDKPLRD